MKHINHKNFIAQLFEKPQQAPINESFLEGKVEEPLMERSFLLLNLLIIYSFTKFLISSITKYISFNTFFGLLLVILAIGATFNRESLFCFLSLYELILTKQRLQSLNL